MPIIRTMQATWPDTRITWIIGKSEHELLRGLPGVSFIPFDKKHGWASWKEIGRQLKGQNCDILLQMQMAYRASWIALRVPANLRLGFHRKVCKDAQWLFTHAQTAYRPRCHVIDGFFGFLEALGIDDRVVRWDLPIPDEARQWAGRHLGESGEYLMVQPSSSQRYRNYRDWRTAHYVTVIDTVHQVHGLRSVLVGGTSPQELRLAAEIEKSAQAAPINLVGKTSLKQLVAVLERGRVIVSPDSGPMHLANALGVPTVGLFAGSNPDRTGPYRFQQYVVNAYPEAVRRYLGKTVDQVSWGRRVRDPRVMDLVTPDAVLDKVDQALSHRSENH